MDTAGSADKRNCYSFNMNEEITLEIIKYKFDVRGKGNETLVVVKLSGTLS